MTLVHDLGEAVGVRILRFENPILINLNGHVSAEIGVESINRKRSGLRPLHTVMAFLPGVQPRQGSVSLHPSKEVLEEGRRDGPRLGHQHILRDGNRSFAAHAGAHAQSRPHRALRQGRRLRAHVAFTVKGPEETVERIKGEGVKVTPNPRPLPRTGTTTGSRLSRIPTATRSSSSSAAP